MQKVAADRASLLQHRGSHISRKLRTYYQATIGLPSFSSKDKVPQVSSVKELWQINFEYSGVQPDVTIIIPAFGSHEMTAECLIWLYKSLQSNNSRCEVIVVDDASHVKFADVFGEVQGLRILRNELNLGFLSSCNRAATIATGTDILLLNNDTYPIGRWVDHMRERLLKTPSALVVGARLVGLDGLLQESGGVIFSDASGWNFGRGWAADDPRCTYAREVDYCSGAALLVQGQFARDTGLFDSRFSPAYYEDTDLCFEARRRGGSVWVEPKAVVIHREGASHGTATSAGIKKYQEVNRHKFADKWRQELNHQCPADSRFVWTGRTRSTKQRLLVIDEEIPRRNAQSGALRMFNLLKLLRDLSYEVTFLPRNGRRLEPFVTELEDIGVEVLGPQESYWDYIVAIRSQISAVWVCRVGVMEMMHPAIATDLEGIPIIFDTVDLHHLREDRESAVRGSSKVMKSSKNSELGFLKTADVVVVVSEHEAAIARELTSRPVMVVSNIHELVEPIQFPPMTKSAAFVGSFRHSPNEDGIVWFIDKVMPLITKSESSFELHIVGESPPESLKSRRSENVVVHGWVDEIDSILRHMRLSVAPLRFGAGVKGKISQALSLGLPVVTTAIGAEGMSLETGTNALVCDLPEEFAAAVLRLLRDDDYWRLISTNGVKTAERNYGKATAYRQIANVLANCERK